MITTAQATAHDWKILVVFDTIAGERAEWLEIDMGDKGTGRIQSIPFLTDTVHLYDRVSYYFDEDGDPIFLRVVEAANYKTLRIGFHPWNQPLDPEAAFARAGISRRLKALGLDFDRWDDVMVAAVPPSYNLARIEVLKMQCQDLCFEWF